MCINRFLNNERGFTLTELMVVAVIIGILVAVAMPVFLNATSNTKLKTCMASLRLMDGAIQTYGADNQVDPASLNDLVPLYIKEIPSEPEGGSYSFIPSTSLAPPYAECSIGHSY